MKRYFITLGLLSICLGISSKTELANLKVEYQKAPLAVEVKSPRFSWQMTADDDLKGWRQTAYEIIVTDEKGKQVWNSGVVKSDASLNVSYQGEALSPVTRYHWTLNVWNQKKEKLTATSSFETGLMMRDDYNHSVTSLLQRQVDAATDANARLKAWGEARWIGRKEGATMFYAPYLPVFRLHYKLQLDKATKTTRAAFLFGANDPRLMDRNKNLLGVENAKDSSYIKVELDIAPLGKGEDARVMVYRKGYRAGEDDTKAVAIFNVPQTVIGNSNKYDAHTVDIIVNAGQTEIRIDGTEKPVGSLVLNPTGKRGGDYIAYPVVGDMGYAMTTGQKATFSDVEVRNFRSPQAVITTVQKEALTLDGGKQGLQRFVTAKENTAPMLRSVFRTSNKKIAKARIYATARGIYDLYLNGKRVGDAYFNPGVTQYDKSQMYQTFDVTDIMRQNEKNVIGAILSEGWWSGGATFVTDNWNFFGDRQSLLAKLQITYDDESVQTIVTSPQTWKTYADGPVRYGSFFQGEVYDARKEKSIEGWATAAYDDSEWLEAEEIKEGNFFPISNNYQLLADMATPIMPIDTLTAKSMEEVRPGVYVYDLGQNMAGVPLLSFSSVKAGTEVKVRFAEVRYPDLPQYKEYVGMIMTENLRVAQSQDVYVTKGETEEVFSPRFTSHGFRYVEITGVEKPLPMSDVRAIAISSMDGLRSHFETSNTDINRLWLNTVWSTRSNFMSVPTDCPQRNERLGWMGDISVFGRSATFLTDASQFLRRYLVSVRDMQSDKGKFPDVAPTGCGFGGLLWGSAGITVPWECYLQYGDKAMLTEHYDAMKQYIKYVLSDCIDPKTNVIVQQRQWGDLGDWLSLEDERNDKSLIWEAYFVFDLDIMTQVAKVLGKTDDEQWYADLAKERRAFFAKTYVEPATGKTLFSAFDERRKGQQVDTQTSYVLPLAFNVVDETTAKKMANNLKTAVERGNANYPSYSLLTGFIGTAWINKALSDWGMSDVAYRLLAQDTFPSWLYPVKNGATTVWERLNSYTQKDGFGKNNSMNSFNHYSFGAVVAWMYNYSLGIRRDEMSPGFKHFILQPEVDPTGHLDKAEGYYDSMYGRIKSRWEKKEGATEYCFTIPANTSATVILSTKALGNVRIDGRSVNKRKTQAAYNVETGQLKMELVAGKYRVEVMNDKR